MGISLCNRHGELRSLPLKTMGGWSTYWRRLHAVFGFVQSWSKKMRGRHPIYCNFLMINHAMELDTNPYIYIYADLAYQRGVNQRQYWHVISSCWGVYLPAKAFSNKHRQKMLLPEPAKRASNRLFQPTRIATSTDRLLIGMPEMRLKLRDFKNGMASFLKINMEQQMDGENDLHTKIEGSSFTSAGPFQGTCSGGVRQPFAPAANFGRRLLRVPPPINLSTNHGSMYKHVYNIYIYTYTYTYINTYIHICIYAYEYLYLSLIYIYIYIIANTTTPKSPWSTPSNESNVWNGPISSGCDHFDDKTWQNLHVCWINSRCSRVCSNFCW